MSTDSRSSRRDFVRTTVGGALAAMAVPAIQARAGSPNDRIGIGFIGCGNRAGAHMGLLSQLQKTENAAIDLVAVSDLYRPRMERAKARFKIPHAYADYREMLASRAVDIVCIATCDHQHGYHAIDAIGAGKDVYCEKPVTHWRQFELTKKLAEVVAHSDRVFQLGTQAMSDGAWRQMKQLVKEGLIGKPFSGETGFFRVGDWGEANMPIDDPHAQPGPDLNWEAWLAAAPKRAFSVDRLFRWRLFEDYAGGPVTDLYPHSLTQVVDILGVGFPETVVATGGMERDAAPPREVPDTCNLIAHYPEKVTISLIGTQANDFQTTTPRGSGGRSPVIRGWDGSLSIDKNNKEIVFTPLRQPKAKAPQRFAIEHPESVQEHWKNLLECSRKRDKATFSPMDLALRTQTVLHMAALAVKQGAVARFDAKEMKLVV